MNSTPDLSLVREIAIGILGDGISLERVSEGVSTFVYRIRRGDETFYLRILPEEASFAVEVHVHEILRTKGVRVPQVLHFEVLNPLVQKSLMVVAEIPGRSIANEANAASLGVILHEAGKDLALLNGVPVEGFGWIDRTFVETLRGEQPTLRAFYADDLAYGVGQLPRLGISDSAIAALRILLEETLRSMDGQDAVLVHGDFDVFHIYCNHNRYSGLIDLGEIMGNHRFYDLALMLFYDELPRGTGAFDALLAGYSELHPISEDDRYVIVKLALLFGIWKIAKECRKPALNAPFVKRLSSRVRALLTEIQGTGVKALS